LTRDIVAGVGMIPFKKPDAANVYVAMGSEAARREFESSKTLNLLTKYETHRFAIGPQRGGGSAPIG
jgi:hypothetical protein